MIVRLWTHLKYYFSAFIELLEGEIVFGPPFSIDSNRLDIAIEVVIILCNKL